MQIALCNPYCGYLVLSFEKLEEFHFPLGVSNKRLFDLFDMQSADKNFIFSLFFHRHLLLRMISKNSEDTYKLLWITKP